MFTAMQIYKEGERTFFNTVSSRKYKSLKAAIKCAKEKGKGLPYVVQGSKVVWTPFPGLHTKQTIDRFIATKEMGRSL